MFTQVLSDCSDSNTWSQSFDYSSTQKAWFNFSLLGYGMNLWLYFLTHQAWRRTSVDSRTSSQAPAYPGGDHQTHRCHAPPHPMWQAFTASAFLPQICIIKLIIEICELRGVQTSQSCKWQGKELLQIGEEQEDRKTNMWHPGLDPGLDSATGKEH